MLGYNIRIVEMIRVFGAYRNRICVLAGVVLSVMLRVLGL